MKILFLEAVQSYGGAQIATVDLAYRLHQAGHEVCFVDCYGCCAPYVERLKLLELPLTILDPRDEPFVIHKYHSRIRNAFRLLAFVPHRKVLKKRLAEVLNTWEPNAVVCYNFKVLSLLEKSTRYTLYFYAHGWFLPNQISRLNRYVLARTPDRILAISQATKMALYAGGIAPLDRISVVHNAIDPTSLPDAVAEVPKADGRFKVLVSGGFLPDKGLHIAVEIAKTLKERGQSIYLIITGIVYKGPISQTYYEHILELIDRYGLSDCVEVVCGKSNVIDYFRACDCLIHPSASEGFGLVVLEAMALGKPVVVNAVGGVTDMVLDGFTGIITPHNDVAAYAQAIEKLSNDVAYRSFLATNAQRLIECSFNVHTQLKQIETALNASDQ